MITLYAFFGPPGGGKGTLSRLCINKLNWAHVSTGDLCRKHIAEKTDLGNQIDFAIKSGKLVSDSVIIDMVIGWIEENADDKIGVILDGAPRTVPQVEGLLGFIKKHTNKYKLKVINLEISDQELIERLSARRICKNKECQRVYSVRNESLKSLVDGICDDCESELIQRSDDKSEAVKVRLEVYKLHSQKVLDFYKESGIEIVTLNAEKPIDKVFEELVSKMD